jgi:hypothetical protein
MNDHLSAATIADYFADALSDADQLAVEEHVSGCDVCALDAQDLFAEGTPVDRLVDRWTAREHGYAANRAERAALVDALEQVGARATSASLRARLAAWAEAVAEQAEAAARVVLETPARAAYRLARQAPDLARPSAAPMFAPAPASMPVRGRAAGGPPGAPAQPIVVRMAGGGPTAQVAVNGGRREVVVRLDGVPRGSEPPLVLLVPTEPPETEGMAMAASRVMADAIEPVSPPPPPGEARLAVPTPSAGSAGWIARFEGLPPGAYLLVFEPSREPDART